MMALNAIAIAGNLTRDAELRSTRSGSSVLTFTVAVNNRKRQGDEWVDDPAFVPCVMFGNRAEAIATYLRKGAKVGVCGRISESKWEDNGQRRSRLEVIVNDVEFMQPRGSEGRSGYRPEQYAPEPQYRAARQPDSVPF